MMFREESDFNLRMNLGEKLSVPLLAVKIQTDIKSLVTQYKIFDFLICVM